MEPRTEAILSALSAGELTGRELAAKLGVTYDRSFRSTLGNLHTQHRITSHRVYKFQHGSSPCYYRLPDPWIAPTMTAGEWMGWHPTGSVPSEVRRLAT